MHFATLIPNWESIDSVRFAHSALELTSIVSFGLLAMFDILAHLVDENKKREKMLERIGLFFFAFAVAAEVGGCIYGQRNDTLSENKIRSLDSLATDAEGKATGAKVVAEALKTDLKEANRQLGEIKEKTVVTSRELGASEENIASLSSQANEIGVYVNAIESTISARRVADDKGLENDLRADFKGSHIIFKSNAGLGDDEPFWLCSQLVEIAKKADVHPVNECATEPIGRFATTNLAIDAPTIEEAQHLAMVLKKQRVLNGWQVGRVPGWAVSLRGGLPLTVMVGVRPSVPFMPNADVLKTPPFKKGAANSIKHK